MNRIKNSSILGTSQALRSYPSLLLYYNKSFLKKSSLRNSLYHQLSAAEFRQSWSSRYTDFPKETDR